MIYTRELDSLEDIVVPRKEFRGLVANATKYEMICSAIEAWESHGKDTVDGNALKYMLILELIDRWEHSAEESDKGENE